MEKTLLLPDGTSLSYEIRRKSVKHLILHLENDGRVWVSAHPRCQESEISSFVAEKSDWIMKHLKTWEHGGEAVAQYSEAELIRLVKGLCEAIYPYYREKGISYPQIKFRKMTSQWGNCRPKQGILTFNKNLCYAPYECISYVVWHEWTHFLVPNHSQTFYAQLETVCPDWKRLKQRLKDVKL
ncbi:MAG: DUF45 domain-containing protein [Clostridia bacterium]|nr:DUF45 domain-containing protein [Clostridia bacterium]